MAWKSLRVFNHTNLKDVVKIAKQRLDALKGESRELKEQEGIGLAYFRGKLSVGYSTKRTDDRVDFYNLTEIESIMVQLNSSSVAKIEGVLYNKILRDNFTADLSQEAILSSYMEEYLGLKMKTLRYQAVYIKPLQEFIIAAYSPKLGENEPLASIRYDKGSKSILIEVKKGLYQAQVKPMDIHNGWDNELRMFEQAIDKALFNVKKEAVLQLLDGINKVGLSVEYNFAEDKVIIKDTESGQVRLKGYVSYGKGFTGFEYRFNYQEYYPDGTKHQYVNSYKTQVTNPQTFQKAVQTFSKNL